VRWFNQREGYGFITPDTGGQDVRVHYSAIYGKQFLREGEKVSFRVVRGPVGAQAIAVSSLP
jgi:CspA family cold shock protein